MKHVIYSKKNESWVAYYRCVQYRSSLDKKRKGCKCSITIRHSDGVVSTNGESHSFCDEAVKRVRLSDITAPPTGSIINVSHEMIEVCKARAIANTAISAQDIANAIADEFDLQYAGRMAVFSSRL